MGKQLSVDDVLEESYSTGYSDSECGLVDVGLKEEHKTSMKNDLFKLISEKMPPEVQSILRDIFEIDK